MTNHLNQYILTALPSLLTAERNRDLSQSLYSGMQQQPGISGAIMLACNRNYTNWWGRRSRYDAIQSCDGPVTISMTMRKEDRLLRLVSNESRIPIQVLRSSKRRRASDPVRVSQILFSILLRDYGTRSSFIGQFIGQSRTFGARMVQLGTRLLVDDAGFRDRYNLLSNQFRSLSLTNLTP